MNIKNPTDTEILDWLERNLMNIFRYTSPQMGGQTTGGQLLNEARGQNGGPSYFRIHHNSIRQGVIDAMNWSEPQEIKDERSKEHKRRFDMKNKLNG